MLVVLLGCDEVRASNLEAQHVVAAPFSEGRIETAATLLDDLGVDAEDEIDLPELPDAIKPHGITPDPPRVSAPASMMLVAAGLLSLLGMRRRR